MKYIFILILILVIAEISFIIWCCPSDRLAARRKEAMKRCVELQVQPELPPANSHKTVSIPVYGVRFEDEFFCPTRPYTILEALNRAESVLNTRGKPLEVVLKETPEGTILVSMFGKANGAGGQWELKINGSEKFIQPLNKITLQGSSWISFVYLSI